MTEAGKREIVWRPTKEYVERSRIGRFMRAHQIGSLEELQRRSIVDPEWYWDAVVRDLGVRWTRPYERVLDSARGIQWPRWFPGGLLNFADNCVDKNVDAGRGDKPAIIWEGDDGQSRTLTYRELAREVNRLANALTRLGVAEGDRVGVFLPMSPEAAIATLAVVRIGAVYTPCFSASGLRGEGARHGRRLPSPRPGREDEGDRRRGRRRVAERQARRDLPAARPRGSVDGGARSLVARPRRQGIGPVPRAPGRGRPTVPDHLHVGDDRAPEGGRAHSRRIPAEDRERLRLLSRRRRGRPPLLAHRPRLAHGPHADHGGALSRRHGRALRGRAGLPEARPPLGHRRAPPGDRHGPLADRGAQPHAPRRRARPRARALLAAHPGLDGRALEPRALPVALRERRQGAPADHQLHGRDRDLGRDPRLLPHRADQAVLLRGDHPGHGRGGLRRDGPTRARPGRRARRYGAVAGHDAGLLEGPGALRGDVLVPLEGRLGARRLGADRRRRVLVPPGALRRHAQDRGQAPRPRGGRVGAGRPSGGGGGGRRRRTPSGEGRGDRLLRGSEIGPVAVGRAPR